MKKMAAGLVMAALVTGLVGCGSSDKNDSDTTQTTTKTETDSSAATTTDTTAKTDTAEKTKLTLWFYFEGKERFDKIKALTDGYTAKNPNVEIEPVFIPFADFKKKLSVGLAASDLPDIVVIDNPDTAAYAAMGLFADITEKVNAWADKDQFFPGPWSSTILDGKQYAIPLGSNNLALFYNEKMLSDAGVTPPTTWDELRTAAKALTKDGTTGIGIAAPGNEEGTFQFLPWLLSAGATFDNVGGAEGAKAYGFLADLVNDGSMSKDVINWTQADVMKQFASGKIAMMVNGPWQLPELATNAPDLKYGIALLPKDQQYASVLGGENLGIVNGKHVDQAVDFAMYVESPDVLKDFAQGFGYFPARKDVAADPYWADNDQLKVFADNMNYAQPRGPHPKWPEISNALSEALDKTLLGSGTAEDNAKEAQAKIDKILGK
ncbi:carbohydrate ABC transporter substrate-binding protein (CUT1 family) [Paenibacillus cellulosilyticus]|uniref:Carbohydrate ABC transporter substrate-binding protein (CUT1 family) n=1 Tax=Paenibacillus cellulosilyticus TaxID=375489 RepID=A0A2V2Z796_9BACL|nr:ABC transporter substrate-binding protein [Paenibacillus cellulosilyticus]PWW07236.1 carbohydrate ABC transporter substrate-binding protein (CUT1 family) [Paenibacillus cellulosilyticus]QKS44573.1 ABC transporter substrate-binding protein [Paenibacillus cellulosilyticus]